MTPSGPHHLSVSNRSIHHVEFHVFNCLSFSLWQSRDPSRLWSLLVAALFRSSVCFPTPFFHPSPLSLIPLLPSLLSFLPLLYVPFHLSFSPPEIASLAAKCVSAVDIFDRSLADTEALEAAQIKFDDILSAPSLADACKKIDDLAARQQLDAPLMLLSSKAWAAAKESNMMKEEVGGRERRGVGREGGSLCLLFPYFFLYFAFRVAALPFHFTASPCLLFLCLWPPPTHHPSFHVSHSLVSHSSPSPSLVTTRPPPHPPLTLPSAPHR